MEQNTLTQYDPELRTAYLSVLAGMATADHDNSQEEVAFIQQMAVAAEIPDSDWESVEQSLRAPQNIRPHLEKLKDSDLKYALMADLLNLCYADGEMDEEEVQQIGQIKQILDISDGQLETVQEYVQKANQVAEEKEENPGMMGLLSGNAGGMVGDFLGQTGLQGKFQQNDIPTQNFQSGSTIGTMLTGLATNFIQSQLSGGNATRGQSQGGGIGAMVGSMLGGSGAKQQSGGLGGMLSSFVSSPQGQQAISGIVSQVVGGQQKGKGLGNLTSLLGGGVQQRRQQPQQGGGIGNLVGALLGG